MGTYSGAALRQRAEPSDLLRAGLENNPDGLGLVSARTRFSWQALDDMASRVASGYLAMGLEPGDRVASLMPNCYELVLHYLACFKAGLVATPLNYRYTAREIDHALAVSEARMLFCHVERDHDLSASELVAELPLGRVTFEGPPGEGVRIEDLMHGHRPRSTFAAPDPTAPAVIFFTSGSTGRPTFGSRRSSSRRSGTLCSRASRTRRLRRSRGRRRGKLSAPSS